MVGLFLLTTFAWTGGAHAAPPAQSPRGAQWAGFYAGGEVGGAWSQFDWSYTNANYFNTFGPVIRGYDFDQNASGVIGGLFAGYNFQSGPWIYGIEVSASGSNLEREEASPFFPTIDVYTSKIDWLATVTGRIGYTWGRWLLFAKGGWAGGDVRLTLHDTVLLVHADSSAWANGWTVGGGADYMLRDGVSLGVVYNYADLGVDGETVTCPTCGTGVGFGTPIVNGDIQVQSIMARLSVHFGR